MSDPQAAAPDVALILARALGTATDREVAPAAPATGPAVPPDEVPAGG